MPAESSISAVCIEIRYFNIKLFLGDVEIETANYKR
jgi:hypothetical protein